MQSMKAIIAELLLHGKFPTARSAARALCSLGRVCKSWYTLSKSEELWKILVLRCSPAAPFLPAGMAGMEPAGPEFVISPFTSSVVDGALARGLLSVPFRELFKKRMLVAELGATSRRKTSSQRSVFVGQLWGRIAAPLVHFSFLTMPCFTCTTLGPAGQSEAVVPVSELSFMFEVFESDHARHRRERWLADFKMDCSEEPARRDFVTEKLCREFMASPHFAAPDEEKQNLVWSATVLGNETGAVVSVPRNRAGCFYYIHILFYAKRIY